MIPPPEFSPSETECPPEEYAHLREQVEQRHGSRIVAEYTNKDGTVYWELADGTCVIPMVPHDR